MYTLGFACGNQSISSSQCAWFVAFAVPHRQYVFTIPKVLRVYFRNDCRLLGDLCLAARDSLRLFFVEHLGLPKGKIGAVLAIHTFGDYLNFHPHVHMLVSNGFF